MLSSIKNLIKQCIVRVASDDSKSFPILSVSYHEKPTNVAHLTPYGTYSNPPVNAIGVIFTIEGQEESRWAIVNTPNTRPKNLLEGEVVICNTLTGSKAYFKADGSIEIDAQKDLPVNVSGSATFTIAGNCSITSGGDVSVQGNNVNVIGNTISLSDGSLGADTLVTTSALKSYVDNHVHSGVTTGSGTSGPPTVPLPTTVGTTIVKAK